MAIKGITPQGYCPSISTIKLDSGAAASALHGRSMSNGHPGALCCPFLSTVQTRQHFSYTTLGSPFNTAERSLKVEICTVTSRLASRLKPIPRAVTSRELSLLLSLSYMDEGAA